VGAILSEFVLVQLATFRGASKVYERLQDEIGVGDGETTEDLRFTLETVACLGCCGLSPVVMINDDTHGRLEPENLKGIVDQL